MAIIKLKKGFSGVTPTGLTLAEPAFDYKDNKLYVGVTASAIWVGGEVDNSTALGTSQIKIPTQFAVKTYIDNLGLSPGVLVTSLNGVTGIVTLGVTAGPGLSIVNPTGSGKGITLINTGVLSVMGRTGTVSNIAVTDAAQSFSGIQSFANGITAIGPNTFSGINRFTDIRNRINGTTLSFITDGVGVTPGLEAQTDISFSPYGNFVVTPSKVGIAVGGSSPRLEIENNDDAGGRFLFSGGDIQVSLQSTASTGSRNGNVRFLSSGGTGAISLRGITAIDGNRVIQLPNHTGIAVVPSDLGTSGRILRANGITAQPTWIDPTAAGFTVAGASTAVSLQGGAAGSLPYNTAVSTTTFLGIGTANQVLTVNSSATAPQWTSPNSAGFTAFQATRALNIDGGAAGSLPYNTAANTTTFLNIGANLTVLRSNGTTFSWVDPSTAGFTAAGANIAANDQGGAAGNLRYQTAANTSAFVTSAGSTAFFLTYNTTTNTPTWVNPNTTGFTAFGSSVSVNLQGGANGSLPYQTAANTTTFLPIGSNLTVLRSNGTTFSWVDPSTAGFTAAGANIAVNLQGGAAGNLHYQTAANTSAFVSNAGATGLFLSYNTTTNVPFWVNPNAVGFTAFTSTNVAVSNDTTDTLAYITFVGTASDTNQLIRYSTGLTYNAVNNFLEANIDGGLF